MPDEQKVRLIATKAYRYGGRALKAGDVFEAKRKDAKVLTATKRADEAPPLPPPTSDDDETDRRRRYRRRDLRSED